jgi:hypothetical protein
MKKYLLLYFGTEAPDQGIREAWLRWFTVLGDRVIDSGNPLGACLEVGGGATRALDWAGGASMGYSIVSARSLEEATGLLAGCPAQVVRIHEAVPM